MAIKKSEHYYSCWASCDELHGGMAAERAVIAEVPADMDEELEQRRVKTRALKQAIMQELLTGRIRLV